MLRVREEISTTLEDLRSSADPLTVRAIIIAERAAMLERQIAGCMLSHAVLLGATAETAPTFMRAAAQRMIADLEADPKRLAERFQTAKDRSAAIGG